MYTNFFRFSEKPFEVTPDPKFLYLIPSYQEILAALIYGIQERRGFITLIGEAGTGKTTLLNAMMEKLPVSTKTAFIFNTSLTFKQMFLMALDDLKLINERRNLSKLEAIQHLNKFALAQFEKGGNVVLIIDEAQNLKQNTLENLRLISNLETPKHKLVQIVLSGQPALDTILNQPNLKQLVQRISLKRFSKPLYEEETYNYINHRLSVANCKDQKLFKAGTLKLIWEYSQGIPRKINILCDNALLIAYALNKKKIDETIIREAIRDLIYRPSKDPYNETDELLLDETALL
jgi:general secretion pathway protein A